MTPVLLHFSENFAISLRKALPVPLPYGPFWAWNPIRMVVSSVPWLGTGKFKLFCVGHWGNVSSNGDNRNGDIMCKKTLDVFVVSSSERICDLKLPSLHLVGVESLQWSWLSRAARKVHRFPQMRCVFFSKFAGIFEKDPCKMSQEFIICEYSRLLGKAQNPKGNSSSRA